jgi:hypothetical protein
MRRASDGLERKAIVATVRTFTLFPFRDERHVEVGVSVFEIIMLACFGAAWPVSIYKSLKTRAVEGKSLPFLIIIVMGYIAGIFHKIFFHYDQVIFLYILNVTMVSIDIFLYLRNKRFHQRRVRTAQ